MARQGIAVATMPTVRVAGFTRRDLAHRFGALGFRTGAEIGVRQGAFALCLCQAIPGLHLICVDPWLCYPSNPKQFSQDRQDRNYAVACARLQGYDVEIVRAFSLTAVQQVPRASLDFVYIDGSHRYQDVLDDVMAWSDRVRPGGIVSGDDVDAPGVRRALEEFTASMGITQVCLTDDPDRRNRKGETFTSWWWVKP